MRTARQRVPTLSWRHWFARTGGCESVGNGGRESAGNGGRESVGNGGRGSVGTWLRGSVGTGLRWCICCAAAILIAIQLFIPPIVGLSDQGDFARVIGHFGYAREDKATPLADAYVAPKYVRDPHARFPELEQPTSEYIFVATALLLNKLVSRDGKFDIVIMGVVHGAAFPRGLRAPVMGRAIASPGLGPGRTSANRRGLRSLLELVLFRTGVLHLLSAPASGKHTHL